MRKISYYLNRLNHFFDVQAAKLGPDYDGLRLIWRGFASLFFIAPLIATFSFEILITIFFFFFILFYLSDWIKHKKIKFGLKIFIGIMYALSAILCLLLFLPPLHLISFFFLIMAIILSYLSYYNISQYQS